MVELDHPSIRLARSKPRLWLQLIIVWLLAALTMAILVPIVLWLTSRDQTVEGTTLPPNHSVVCAPEVGAAATDSKTCSAMAAEILKLGGNAVDASITAALCLGLVHPESSGLGGGMFMLVRSENDSIEVIDAREEAPASANETMFVGHPNASTFGGRAVAIPGELSGLFLAHSRHGKLPWPELIEPVASLAEKGAPVDDNLAEGIEDAASLLLNSPTAAAAAEIFFVQEGDRSRPRRAGETLTNPKLAATLRAVGERGAAALTHGPIARAIVETVQRAGGNLTLADLQGYRPIVRRPLVTEILGMRIAGVPPPSSGGATVLQALVYLSGFEAPFSALSPALATHRTVEALKHAFALRMSLGDPAYVPSANAVVADMLSPSFNDKLRRGHSDFRTRPLREYGGSRAPNTTLPHDYGTSHISIVDSEGNAVAMTTTINTGFGAKLVVNGFVLNNEMDDFSTPGQPNAYGLAPSEANYIRPGKRPLSSMSPTIVLQDGMLNGTASALLRMAVGGSGGSRIISGTLQVLLRHLLRNEGVAAAVSEPRVHHQYLPNVVHVEDEQLLEGGWSRVPQSVRDGLRERGHDVQPWAKHATVQAVVQDFDTLQLTAVSDVRKGGVPACA